ncbi:MAG: hypothetical protein C5B56_16230 [Proteobacteria bacterium]|nr:MAG: hypothetical protein C5B56_16230 [Pseudomonadota bacterium]
MISDPWSILIAVVAVTFLGLAKGGLAGIGMAATPLMALVLPPLQAAAVLLPILIVQDVISVWTYRRTFSGWNLKVTLPGAALGVAIAWVLAAHISDALLRLFVGAIGVAFVLNGWLRKMPAQASKPTAAGGAFWGGLAGFTSTLVQAGSPPFQIHLLPQKLPKLTFVGTNMIFFAVVNWFKVVPFFGLGQFSSQTLATSLMLLPLAVATNFLGIRLVRIMPNELFFRFAYVLMAVISLTLIGQAAVHLAKA